MKKIIINLLIGIQFIFIQVIHAQYDTLQVDGYNRIFEMYLPESYSGDSAVPLLLVVHGFTNNISTEGDWYEIRPIADRENFIICYPFGTVNPDGRYYWAAGSVFDSIDKNVDDIHFLSVLLDTLLSRYHIDEQQIFAMGHSNGSMMVYRMALEMSDRLKALACVSGPLLIEDSSGPLKPIPIMHIHGINDPIVPWGGEGTYDFPAMPPVIDSWLEWNHCNVTPDTVFYNGLVTGVRWPSDSRQSDYVLFRANGIRHDWPRESNCNWNGSEYIWQFFQNEEFTPASEIISYVNTYPAEETTMHWNYTDNMLNLKLDTKNNSSIKFELIDLNGRVVFSENSGSRQDHYEYTVNMSPFGSGVYFIRIATDSYTKAIKIMLFN